MVYECDLDKVWNLPAGRSSYYDSSNGSYCAIGKVSKACGIGVDAYHILDQEFEVALQDATGFDHLAVWGMKYNDCPMITAKTPEDKQQAHINACKLLVQKCLEAGMITLKESDLEIVKELKQYEKELAANV